MLAGGSTHSKNVIWDLRNRENHPKYPKKAKFSPHLESANHLRIIWSKPSKWSYMFNRDNHELSKIFKQQCSTYVQWMKMGTEPTFAWPLVCKTSLPGYPWTTYGVTTSKIQMLNLGSVQTADFLDLRLPGIPQKGGRPVVSFSKKSSRVVDWDSPVLIDSANPRWLIFPDFTIKTSIYIDLKWCFYQVFPHWKVGFPVNQWDFPWLFPWDFPLLLAPRGRPCQPWASSVQNFLSWSSLPDPNGPTTEDCEGKMVYGRWGFPARHGDTQAGWFFWWKIAI